LGPDGALIGFLLVELTNTNGDGEVTSSRMRAMLHEPARGCAGARRTCTFARLCPPCWIGARGSCLQGSAGPGAPAHAGHGPALAPEQGVGFRYT
jgi:hypothetical protein